MTDQEFLKAAYDMQEYCINNKSCSGCPFDHEVFDCDVLSHVPADWGISKNQSVKYEA